VEVEPAREGCKAMSVGDALQIEIVDVEGTGGTLWTTFRAFHVSDEKVHLVRVDEPDFHEEMDLELGEGGMVLLPHDIRPLPEGTPQPAENGCVVWAACYYHLKGRSQERLEEEVMLPGPGGMYRIFEEKLNGSLTHFRWSKHVMTPNNGRIKSLTRSAPVLLTLSPLPWPPHGLRSLLRAPL
jgi:hypothetical protein